MTQTIAEERVVKFRRRLKAYGEEHTPRHMIDRMIDLVRDELETGPESLDKTFLGSAAGDGNFLVAILRCRLKAIEKRCLAERWATESLFRARVDLRSRVAGAQPSGCQGGHARRVS